MLERRIHRCQRRMYKISMRDLQVHMSLVSSIKRSFFLSSQAKARARRSPHSSQLDFFERHQIMPELQKADSKESGKKSKNQKHLVVAPPAQSTIKGCDHMTCSVCRAEFCWLCKGGWSYGHICPPTKFTVLKKITKTVGAAVWTAVLLLPFLAAGGVCGSAAVTTTTRETSVLAMWWSGVKHAWRHW